MTSYEEFKQLLQNIEANELIQLIEAKQAPEPDDFMEQVRAQHKKMALKHHPDRVSHGKSEAEVKQITEKFQTIQSSYEKIDALQQQDLELLLQGVSASTSTMTNGLGAMGTWLRNLAQQNTSSRPSSRYTSSEEQDMISTIFGGKRHF